MLLVSDYHLPCVQFLILCQCLQVSVLSVPQYQAHLCTSMLLPRSDVILVTMDSLGFVQNVDVNVRIDFKADHNRSFLHYHRTISINSKPISANAKQIIRKSIL
jgi:hypothetical protein